MSIFKKIFSSNKDKEKDVKKNKQKTSFFNWLCSSKSMHSEVENYEKGNPMNIPLQSSTKKSMVSVTQTNNTKILQRQSFNDNNDKSFLDGQLRSRLIGIEEQLIESMEDLIQEDGLFIFSDEFGFEFSIQEVLLAKQNILLRVQERSSLQEIIESYENQLIENYRFKPVFDCFSKLKVTVYKTKVNHSFWINFNKSTSIQSHIEDMFVNLGLDLTNEEYPKLKQQIPTLLTLQQYMQFTEHKNKLMSKYQTQNVDQYIKNKLLQKINSKSHTPRNTDSPRTLEKSNSNQQKSESSGYNEYILSMTANTVIKEKISQAPQNITIPIKNVDKNSYEEEIFEFNIYKEEKEQEAKRVAISKQRKKRSRSEDITVGDLHNCQDLEDQNDYFYKRD